MNKQSCRLLVLGNLLMSIPLLLRHFVTIPDDPADFLRGFGVALIIAAAWYMRKGKDAATGCSRASGTETE